MLDNKFVFAAIGTVVVAVLVVVGIVMVNRDGEANEPTPPVVAPSDTPVPGAPKTSGGPIEDGAGDDEGGEGRESEPPVPPNTRESDGSDHDAEMTEADKKKAVAAAEEFWNAYSLRDPKKRNKALEPLVTEWLFERIAVDDTHRIPVIKPDESVVTENNYTAGVVVTRDANGDWYYAAMVYDPGPDRWLVQRANPASMAQIAAAKKEMEGG